MKTNAEQSELLNALMQEKSLSEFRDDLLDQTLTAVRRKKRNRHLGASLLIMAILAVLMLPSKRQPIAPVSSAVQTRPPFEMVLTRPLPSTMVVETRSGAFELLSSTASSLAVVETGK